MRKRFSDLRQNWSSLWGGFCFQVYTTETRGGTITRFLNKQVNFGLFGEFLAQELWMTSG